MKYIIELGEDANMVQVISVTQNGNAYIDSTVYVEYLEQLNSDYINENFGELQDQAYQKGLEEGKKAFDLLESERNSEYQRGLNDAWEAAKKVVLNPDEGGLDFQELNEVFNCDTIQQVFRRHNTLSEVIAKLKAYEEKQKADDKIEVGDEVDAYGNKGVVTYMYEKEDVYCVMMRDGSASIRKNGDIVKTGRHLDIASILEAMKK